MNSHKNRRASPQLEHKFVIVDWAGNLKFHGQRFETFEDAWDFLFERFESDEDRGEFEVIPTEIVGAL